MLGQTGFNNIVKQTAHHDYAFEATDDDGLV
jgi:hypothetical protein